MSNFCTRPCSMNSSRYFVEVHPPPMKSQKSLQEAEECSSENLSQNCRSCIQFLQEFIICEFACLHELFLRYIIVRSLTLERIIHDCFAVRKLDFKSLSGFSHLGERIEGNKVGISSFGNLRSLTLRKAHVADSMLQD